MLRTSTVSKWMASADLLLALVRYPCLKHIHTTNNAVNSAIAGTNKFTKLLTLFYDSPTSKENRVIGVSGWCCATHSISTSKRVCKYILRMYEFFVKCNGIFSPNNKWKWWWYFSFVISMCLFVLHSLKLCTQERGKISFRMMTSRYIFLCISIYKIWWLFIMFGFCINIFFCFVLAKN